MTPTVLIAAPVRNRAPFLPKYLSYLQTLDYPKDLVSYYFLLNDSTDASADILREFQGRVPRVTLETLDLGTPKDVIGPTGSRSATARVSVDARGKPNPTGVYKSLAILRNRVLDHFQTSGADYLLSVDTDIYVRPNLLKRLLGHGKDMVAAMISNRPNRICPNAIVYRKGPAGKPIPERFQVPDAPGVYEVDITGAVCLHSRKVLGCKYAWHLSGEDAPFCLQVKSKGLKIWLDTAKLAEHRMSGP